MARTQWSNARRALSSSFWDPARRYGMAARSPDVQEDGYRTRARPSVLQTPTQAQITRVSTRNWRNRTPPKCPPPMPCPRRSLTLPRLPVRRRGRTGNRGEPPIRTAPGWVTAGRGFWCDEEWQVPPSCGRSRTKAQSCYAEASKGAAGEEGPEPRQ